MILTHLKTSWWWFREEWNHTMVLRVQIKSSYDLLLFKYDYCIITWSIIHDSFAWIPVNTVKMFLTFSECSLASTVSKNKTKKIGHHPRKRDWWANLAPFIPVLVLITRVIHRSTLHFAVAGGTASRSDTWQGESLEHMEQYHIIFVGKIAPFKTR